MFQSRLLVATAAALITRSSAETWNQEKLTSETTLGDASKCFYAIFEGAPCESPGGVYQISTAWYKGHSGGPYDTKKAPKGCGTVKANWKDQHSWMVAELGGPGNLDGGKGIWQGEFDCGDTTAPPTAPPTPAPPTPAPAGETTGTFDAAADCANEAEYSTPANTKVDGVTFCAKVNSAKTEYEFVMLVKPGLAWGAVGFNAEGKMAGTEVMWLGEENGAASLKYKMATSYATPANAADQPLSATVEKVEAGIQAKWTRPFVQGALTTLTDDTTGLNILFVSRPGTPGTFSKHDKTEILSSINLAVVGKSSGVAVQEVKGTAGNLAHGALMILAWACFSPIGVMFMKYGKHLPVSYWFKTHTYLMPCAILATIVAFITILASGVKYDELAANPKSKTHALCGFAVMGLCIVQGLLGAFRGKISGHDEESDKGSDFNHGPNRYIFNGLHRTLGWTLYGLALATIYKGITLFDEKITAENPKVWVQDPAGTLFMAYCYISLGVVVVLELLHITKYQWSSGGPFSCSGNKTKTASFKAEGDLEMKVRTITLALFSAFSIAVTITLWVIIADTTTA